MHGSATALRRNLEAAPSSRCSTGVGPNARSKRQYHGHSLSLHSGMVLLNPFKHKLCVNLRDSCHVRCHLSKKPYYKDEKGADPGVNYQTTEDEETQPSLGVAVALAMLNFYRNEISPFMPSSCRFVPSCSEYSMQAYHKYGVFKGTILTAWRLLRCNPLGPSGFDPPRWFGE